MRALPPWPPKRPKRERRSTAEVHRHLEPAAHADIRSAARPLHCAEPQHAPRGHRNRTVALDFTAPDLGPHVGAGQDDHRGSVKSQRRPHQRALQQSRRHGVAEKSVGELKRQRVHGARRRDAHIPVADPAGMILDRGLCPRLEHLEGRGLVGNVFEHARVDPTLAECLGVENVLQVVAVGFDAGESRRRERIAQAGNRFESIASARDDLGDHGIVVGSDVGSWLDPRLDPHAVCEGDLGEHARARLKTALGILGVDPRFDRCAARRYRQRVEIGQLAGRQPNHPLDEVDTGHLFGDSVLDLNARVDLEEIDIAAGVVEDELDRPRGSIFRRARQTGRRSQQGLAALRGEARGRGFFEDLLVTALHRAVALAQREHLAGSVAENLHFEMARNPHQLLEVEPRLLEVGASEAIGGVECLRELALVGAAPHPDASASRGTLEHHRVADACRCFERSIEIGKETRTRQERKIALLGQLTRHVLEAEIAHLRRRRADEGDSCRLASLCEIGILAEKAVPRMDGLGPGAPRCIEDLFDVEVALGCRRRPEQHRFIGPADVRRVRVRFGVDADRRDAHLAKRAQDAARNRSTVGNEHPMKHACRPRRLPVPNQDADRRRVVGVAGIVELRTVRDENQHVHLGAHLDIAAGPRNPVFEGEPAPGVTGTFMKKLMLLARSRLLMPWP